MKNIKFVKVALLTAATAIAGHAAADSLAERRADSVPIGEWSYTQNLPAPAAGNSAESEDSRGMTDHEGMMDHDGMMMSKEDCMKMHKMMHAGEKGKQ